MVANAAYRSDRNVKRETVDKKAFKIAVFPGDGVGPEVIREALKCLAVISEMSRISFQVQEGLLGGAAIDVCGIPLPAESLALAYASDAVLLGAVGGPKWESLPYEMRPERALLDLREKLGLFANLRPVFTYSDLFDSSPVKASTVQGVDVMIVRELTSSANFGRLRSIGIEQGRSVDINTIRSTKVEIRRIARVAFDLATARRRKLCFVSKASVLERTRLWRNVVVEVGRNYPDVSISHLSVDNYARQLSRNPAQFDVIFTTGMFGDILSDEASVLASSMSMLPSASLGKWIAMYEPMHGSAPDIAGQNMANPLAMILSVGMMLRISFGMAAEAWLLEHAVQSALKQGLRTRDIHREGMSLVGTTAMGEAVIKQI
jgi:3-isopropylmalate dehydrogenase